MSRRNRNNNRYNSRNRNKWDEGYEDDYFDEDEQQESEEDESSDDQDDYDESEYDEDESEDEDYEYDDDEYDDESEDEDYEEYDEEDEEDEEDEDESDEEYDEDEYDDEDVEEEDESDEDDDDELESEIDAAAESTAKKTVGNSDLLSKLRGQMRPQINEESTESTKDTEIHVSPLSLFGRPIVQDGKKDNSKGASNVTPQHANAKIVQSVKVGGKSSSPVSSGTMQKAGSGRVITAQSQNGASVSSVQPRDLEAEKAEADRKQKEKKRLEEEQKEKEEKSNRILDKYKGKKTFTGNAALKKTKAGAAWLWAGVTACFLWIWSRPKHAWQTWRIFNSAWWSGLGTGVWNVMKKPFTRKPVAVTDEGVTDGAASGSDSLSDAPTASASASRTRKRNSRKKNVDLWDAESTASSENVQNKDVFASKEPDSRRRLYFSLSSIGAAAVMFLLVLPSMFNGSKQTTDENAVAVNEQGSASIGQKVVADATVQNVNSADSNTAASNSVTQGKLKPVSNSEASGFRNAAQNPGGPGMRNTAQNFEGSGMRNTAQNPAGAGMRNRVPMNAPLNSEDQNYPGFSNLYPNQLSDDYQAESMRNNPQAFDGNQPLVPPAISDDLTPPSVDDDVLGGSLPETSTPDEPELNMSVPEIQAPEETSLETPELGLESDDAIPEPELEANPEASMPEIESPEVPDVKVTEPEISTDEVPVPDDIETDVSVPDLMEPDAVNADAAVEDLSAPETPSVDIGADDDSLNAAVPDVPEDVDANQDANADAALAPDAEADELPSPETTSPVESPSEPAEAPTPDDAVPDVTMPELPDTEPIDSNPIEEPKIEEPTVPEPTIPEPNSIETGVATQLSEPSEPLLAPEDDSTKDSLVASATPTEAAVSPEASPVALGAPGPLVSSSNASPDQQTQNVAKVNTYNASPSADSSYGINGYNNGYVYNSSGVYTVQPNDSFWTIAKRIYGSGEYARALAQYNSSRVTPQSLTASTQIMTPPPETLEQQYPELCPARSAASTASVSPTLGAPAGTRVYIVDQEESVMEIARRELGSILYCSQVYALNQELLSGSVDRVKPGVRLLLPVKN